MKMITEYLDHALTFERMAGEEDDPALKAKFEKQATAYRKLAKERAVVYGMPLPSPPTEKPASTKAARQAVEDFANDQREIFKKKPPLG